MRELLISEYVIDMSDGSTVSAYTTAPDELMEFVLVGMAKEGIPINTDTIAFVINEGAELGVHTYTALTQAEFDASQKATITKPLTEQDAANN